MKKLLLPLVLLVLCYVLFFTCIAMTYDSLPPKVASHFDIAGRPNGWMSRDTLIDFTLVSGTALPLFVIVVMAGVGRIPVSFVNIPNRNYWLAPERRRETAAVLGKYGLWLGCAMVMLFTGMHLLIVAANATPGNQQLNNIGIWSLLGGFLLVIIVWSLLLRNHFARQPDAL